MARLQVERIERKLGRSIRAGLSGPSEADGEKGTSSSSGALLVVGSLSQTVSARPESGNCKRFRSSGLYDFPKDTKRIVASKLSMVTERHTKADPLTFEFSHQPVVGTVWPVEPWVFVVEPVNEYFNIQVEGLKRGAMLNARLEWATPSVSNIDLGLYNALGSKIIWSEAWNNTVLDAAFPLAWGSTGGPGFEQISNFWARNCMGFTLVSAPHNNLGEDVVLKIWLSSSRR